ncbi:MAG: 16S rRNA (guanine(966)-N(2))-methyltransferase RsmD [Desulfuromonas sp.]|nr:16S rRNA (guanine(966)-N(2))-methyltransferase RsmD [Desulfuromonas sp.]
MRIISGKARGKQLAIFEGKEIRPTSDRVRGSIFSILTSRLGGFNGLRVLDLFAGTGAMGLEALSRGAQQAVFVDSGRQSHSLLEKNCQNCGVDAVSRRIASPVQKALPRLTQPFDVIFLDPPYRQGLVDEVLHMISDFNLLKPGGIICAEEDKSHPVATHIGRFEQIDQRNYGSTTIHLFTHCRPSED